LVLQLLQDEIDGFEEQRNRREDLALFWVGENTLFDAIMWQVSVEVDFGFVYQLEIGADHDSYEATSVVAGYDDGGATMVG